MPHGPSAVIEKFDIDAVRWDKQLEKTYYDTDLKASEAVLNLHNKDVPFTAMQKAFSVGAFGTKKKENWFRQDGQLQHVIPHWQTNS